MLNYAGPTNLNTVANLLLFRLFRLAGKLALLFWELKIGWSNQICEVPANQISHLPTLWLVVPTDYFNLEMQIQMPLVISLALLLTVFLVSHYLPSFTPSLVPYSPHSSLTPLHTSSGAWAPDVVAVCGQVR